MKGEYKIYSNCLLEALKAKIINPKQNILYKRGSWLCIFKKQWPHFYWYHKPHDKYYCFSAQVNNLIRENDLSWMKQCWYKGEIIEFNWHESKYNKLKEKARIRIQNRRNNI